MASSSSLQVLTPVSLCRNFNNNNNNNNNNKVVNFTIRGRLSKREEPPESKFMKELKRRGMNPTSILEDAKRKSVVDGEHEEDMKLNEDFKRNAILTDIEKNLSNQRQRSMALNSEGLEGLVPRAKLLLRLGGTFFLAFWPLIAGTVAFTSALYLYFGAAFIHDGSDSPVSPPQYIDPYTLLEEERITRIIPRVD
ncbi:hypothetical protein ACFE04_023196 [Oxalis oulophora]